MANVSHSTLTGADLHEPKGVAAASAGTVYVADGAASGAWTAHSTFAGVFGSKLYHVQSRFSTGTNGQSLTNATWTTVQLNTELTDELSVSLSSSKMSLASGTYFALGWMRTYLLSTGHMVLAKLRDDTTGSDLIFSPAGYMGSGSGGVTLATEVIIPIQGRFTLGGTRDVVLQAYAKGSGITTGHALNVVGYNEIYADLCLWKIS